MRVLLDECVDERLRHHLQGHDCETARYAGFAGLENGQLLEAAIKANFEVVITVDRGFEYQQSLQQRRIAVIIFCGRSVLLEDLTPLVPACLAKLTSIRPGQVVRIGDE
jgi:predicted nuclease of predicted toxin-antitoxin system